MAVLSYNYLVINGNVCDGISGTGHLPQPAHGGFSVAIQDVDSASTGRGADGNMIRDRVGVKAKIFLKFPPLSASEMKALMDAISDVSFSVTYPDPRAGGTNSGTFYVGDRTAPIYRIDETKATMGQGILWENVSFNLIEM